MTYVVDFIGKFINCFYEFRIHIFIQLCCISHIGRKVHVLFSCFPHNFFAFIFRKTYPLCYVLVFLFQCDHLLFSLYFRTMRCGFVYCKIRICGYKCILVRECPNTPYLASLLFFSSTRFRFGSLKFKYSRFA